MTAQMTPTERQLFTLARLVSEERIDKAAPGGLPFSLLSDLKDLIPCETIALEGFDSGRPISWYCGGLPAMDESAFTEYQSEFSAVHWLHYWDCEPCSYPDRTGGRTCIRHTSMPNDAAIRCSR